MNTTRFAIVVTLGLLLAWPAFAVSHAAALDTSIGSPGSVIVDAFGNVIFSSDPGVVFKLDSSGVLTQIAGGWTPGFAGDGGPAAQALLDFPFVYPELLRDPFNWGPLVGGLASDANGQIYIADAYNNRVRKIDVNGMISTVAGTGARGGGHGPALTTPIAFPQGLAVDAGGNLFVAVGGGLEELTSDGIIQFITSNNCGNHPAQGLCAPEQIAVDSHAAVYVADGYCDIRKVNPDKTVTEVAGDPRPDLAHGYSFTCGYSGDGGLATKAALNNPFGVAVDGAGNLYIADSSNSCVRKVGVDGVIATYAGVCTSPGYSGDGGPAVAAKLDTPYGVTVDSAGNLYIADTMNNRLRKVAIDGSISTVAGNGAPAPKPGLAATTTALIGSVSGEVVTLTAAVTGGADPAGIFWPGSVKFTANGVQLAVVTMQQGVPSSVTTHATLAAGSYKISATYMGDAVSASSTSTTILLTVAAPSSTPVATPTQGGGGAFGVGELLALLMLTSPQLWGRHGAHKRRTGEFSSTACVRNRL